jgi:[ribosomal protein S5]-alanine N-acetyltransferase
MDSLAPFVTQGRRALLRDFREGDLEAISSIVSDDRVTRWLSFDNRSHDESAHMLEGAIARALENPRSEYYLAVTINGGSDRVIGFCRLALGGVSAAKLGYAIHADYWGRGLATDAASTIVDHGFKHLAIHRITAAVGPDNEASKAVLDRLGFSLEGRLRDHVFTNGAWRDSLLYSLLASDWLPFGVES